MHHIPAAMKIGQSEDEPVNAGESSETECDDPDVAVRDLKGPDKEATHDGEGEEEVREAGSAEVGQVKSPRRAVVNGGGARRGVGIFVAEPRFRNRLRRDFFFGLCLGKQAEDIGGFLFVRVVTFPDQRFFADLLGGCEFL